jgi:hypothetical protein
MPIERAKMQPMLRGRTGQVVVTGVEVLGVSRLSACRKINFRLVAALQGKWQGYLSHVYLL